MWQIKLETWNLKLEITLQMCKLMSVHIKSQDNVKAVSNNLGEEKKIIQVLQVLTK